VWFTLSMFITLTVAPGLTVSGVVNLKLSIMIMAAAAGALRELALLVAGVLDADDAAADDDLAAASLDVDDGFDDEPHADTATVVIALTDKANVVRTSRPRSEVEPIAVSSRVRTSVTFFLPARQVCGRLG
jgi:hypothetical protein